MPTLSAQESMGTIERFIQEVGTAEKRAADKKAEEANTEPGSIGGETSHPVKDVDDRTQAAQEGERSAENKKDVKEDQGPPSVENAPEAKAAFDLSRFAKPTGSEKRAEGEGGAVQTPGSASDDQLQIGTKKEPTGEDPSVETESAKAGKEDPGSSHPARTDNEQLDGHKYAADVLEAMSLEKLASLMSELGNDFCASLAVQEPQAAAQPQRTKTASASPTDAEVAHQAGWELAGLVTSGKGFDKTAVDAMVQQTLVEMIKTAEDDAENVANYIESYQAARAEAERVKSAEDPLADPSQAMPPPPGGGMPAGGDPAAALGMAGAGPGAGMGEGGEEGMLSALGGGDGDGDEAGGEPQVDEQTLELAQILEELGVTPEELEAAMAAEQGGGGEAGGGMAGGMGGGEPPPKEAGDRQRTKTAAVKRGNTREGVREYIQEVISRSRR